MKKVIAVLVLAAAAAGTWYLLAPSRETLVKKAFAQAAAALEKSGVEKAFDSLAKARTLASLVEPQCLFEFKNRKFQLSQERTDVTERIVTVRNMAARIHVEFGDVSVTFSDPGTAKAACGLSYTGDDFGLSVREATSVEAVLRKDPDSGKWRFSHVSLK